MYLAREVLASGPDINYTTHTKEATAAERRMGKEKEEKKGYQPKPTQLHDDPSTVLTPTTDNRAVVFASGTRKRREAR